MTRAEKKFFGELSDRAESMGLVLRDEKVTSFESGAVEVGELEFIVTRAPFDNPDGSVDWVSSNLFMVSAFLDGFEYCAGPSEGGDA